MEWVRRLSGRMTRNAIQPMPPASAASTNAATAHMTMEKKLSACSAIASVSSPLALVAVTI